MVSDLGEQVPTDVEESKMDFALQRPWLLITNGKDWHLQNNVFNIEPLVSHCYYDVGSEIPEMSGIPFIYFSCREWVVADDLVNLLSRETIELPSSEFLYNFCILTSPPSDPSCHIVYFNEEENHLILCQPGDKEFTVRKWDYEFFPARTSAVVAGKLFLTIPNANGPFLLIMVEFKECTYQFELLDMGFMGILSMWDSSYLFEYSGELFMVHKIMCGSSNVAGFKIFRADLLNKKWIPIKKLGRLAIFIAYETARAQCAGVESGIAANSIYFLEHHDLDSYYIYSLEDGTIRVVPTFCSMETTKDMVLDWIMIACDTPFPKLIKVEQQSICQDSRKQNSASAEVEEDEVQISWNMDFALQRPWLLITDGKDWHLQNNVFNIQPLRHCYYDVGSEIPGLTGRHIACSCREWLLLTGSIDNLPDVLVNLLSKETIELPSYDFKYDFCILTSPASDPTCHIVYFNEEENNLIICQPGDKEYTIKKWDYEFFPIARSTVVAGKLFLTPRQDPNCLVMVEFKECTYQFEVVQLVLDPLEYYEIKYESTGVYFFEYSGELFLVYKIMYSVYSSGFKIFRADLLNKKWIRIRNLGRLALFIGFDTAHAQWAGVESGIAANSIYFLEHHDLDSYYYVYNLDDGAIRMIPTFCSMKTTDDMEMDWIMMTCDTSLPKLFQGDQESIGGQDSEKENQTSGEVEEGEMKISWNMIPPELLNLIWLRLFGRDRTWFDAVFRGVCKAWQQISIQDFSIPTTLLEQCQSFSPLLMFQENRTSSYNSVPIFRFFDPIHRKLYRTRIQELREADIHCSRDGWLLVSRDQSIFFFNPLTQAMIELPEMPALYRSRLSFSSKPTCSNCLVVGMDDLGERVYTLKRGDETWIEHKLENRAEDARKYVCNPVVLNGLHYFMSQRRDMLVLNLKNGAAGQFLDCPTKFKPEECLHSRGEDFLVEIDRGLAFVNIKPDVGEISIFKWNSLKKDWELMEDGVAFGGKEMFISKRCSFMDEVAGMGNTIFLPMIDDDAKDGVFYSLATRRYHRFYYNGYSSEQPYYVDKFLDGIWVKPDRKIVGDNNLKWFM